MKKISLCASIFLFLVFLSAAQATNRDVVLTLPAETVHAAVKKILPLTIPTQGSTVQGQLILESLEHLSIRNNVISLHGVLGGRNMTVNAMVANKPIRVQLGELRLPVSCDLITRFDRQSRRLYVSPRFKEQGSGQDAGLASLLDGLAGREYPLDLDALKQLDVEIGTRTISFAMQPTNIVGQDNALVFYLQPQVRPTSR
ncbi:MAG: hypothetical protein Q4G66_11595 [bacterium]|nr:hypothetical protein [bacterium]